MMKRVLLFLLAVSLSGLSAASASVLYGNEFAGPTDLFKLDQVTGALSSIGATGFDNIGDLTSDTRSGSFTIWGVRIASNELVTFDPTTGLGTAGPTITGLTGAEDHITSLAFDATTGTLYGNTTDAFGALGGDALYSIDPTTGVSTLIGRIGFSNVFALGFDNSGALFGVSDASDELISISTASGLGALLGATGLSNSFDIAARPEDGVMFLVDSGTSSLYTIDTVTGATELVGPYGSTTNVVGLAFSSVPVPEPTTLVLVGGGLLLLGLRRSRSRMA